MQSTYSNLYYQLTIFKPETHLVFSGCAAQNEMSARANVVRSVLVAGSINLKQLHVSI